MASMGFMSAVRGRFFHASALVAAAAGAGSLYNGSSLMPMAEADAPKQALDPKDFVPLKLREKEQLTKDTYIYRFDLPAGTTSGMWASSCLVTKAMIADKPGEAPKAVIRPYTPTSPPEAIGYMDLLVKVYPNSKMGNHINNLKVGDSLDFKGPIPKIKYEPNKWKHIGMVAGGTGITPMYQVITEALKHPDDKTTLALVYGSVSEPDIILRKELDELVAKSNGRLRVYYLIDKSNKWASSTKPQQGILKGVGYASQDVLKSFLPPPSPDTMVFVCGPPGLMAAISGPKSPDFTQGELSGALKALGYAKEGVFKF